MKVLVDTEASSYLEIEKIRLRSFASVSLTAQDDKAVASAVVQDDMIVALILRLRMTSWESSAL
jgi:hypothetical protein